mmetsp:Transcript_4224/g.10900  ORF Transcript_4224/g.10900 Transcript_4224/m.10900 type:complete len:345 (-) Transcript_4224:66-1100(-)
MPRPRGCSHPASATPARLTHILVFILGSRCAARRWSVSARRSRADRLAQPLSSVERAMRGLVARRTAFRRGLLSEGARLAEVMTALGDDWVRIGRPWLPADEAREREVVVASGRVGRTGGLGCAVFSRTVAARCARHGLLEALLLQLLLRVPVPLELPTGLIVAAVVQELARVPTSAVACFLVVLAHIGLVVEAADGAKMHGRTLWALPTEYGCIETRRPLRVFPVVIRATVKTLATRVIVSRLERLRALKDGARVAVVGSFLLVCREDFVVIRCDPPVRRLRTHHVHARRRCRRARPRSGLCENPWWARWRVRAHNRRRGLFGGHGRLVYHGTRPLTYVSPRA